MFKTPVLGSLKTLFPPLHQPLPLNRRETQQLLNVLTASFRRHLEREHGHAPADHVGKVGGGVTTSTDRPGAHPTHRHLQAVLSNPLFRPSAGAQQANIGHGKDPMEVFDRAVAQGLMTVKAATGVLVAVQRRAHTTTGQWPGQWQGQDDVGAGLKVLQWLRSSGAERELEFLLDEKFTRLLVTFLVDEGLEPVAWGWLEKLNSGSGMMANYGARLLRFKLLLRQLVYVKSAQSASLDEAYATLLRADDVFGHKTDTSYNLYLSWMLLSRMSTLGPRKPRRPSDVLFDLFVDKGRDLNEPVGFELANLDLHHPSHPDHTKALEYFHDEGTWKRRLQSPGDPSRQVSPQRQLGMGLDAAKRLSSIGEDHEARWLIGLLRSHFKPLLRTQTKIEPA